MRLSQPRITPLTPDELSAEQAEVLAPLLDGGGSLLNIYATLAHHPSALAAFLHWGRYILSRRNTLPARERELVVLRTGFNCKCGYEWAQHARIGQRVGLTEEEVTRIKAGPDAEGWTPAESALLRAADDLVATHAVSDATWQGLSEHFDERQRMDVVFTVGEYTQVSMMLNAFGVQLEPDLVADPDLAG